MRILLIALAAASVAAQSKAAGRPVIYVATNGQDSWSGRLAAPNAARTDGPVATLQRAVELSRELRASAGPAAEPARIVVRRGDYFLDQPVVLGPQDSGLVIQADRGEPPTLYAGRRITGWHRDGDHFWAADLPEVAAGRWDFRMLLVNGVRATRARLPEKGFFENLNQWNVPWMSTTGGGWKRKPTEAELTTMTYKPGDLGPWLDTKNAEVTVYHMWDESQVGVASLDEATHTIHFSSPCTHPPGAFGVHRYVVWNVRQGMHAPGQWYLDRTAGKVVYWPLPGQDMTRAEVLAPTAESVIVLRGTGDHPVEKVTVRGLRLSVTNTPLRSAGFGAYRFAGAVEADHAEGCTLADLIVAHAGGQAIKASNCSGLRVDGCEVVDAGACGIIARGPRNVITNNDVHHIGAAYPSAIAISMGGDDWRVTHNEIHDTTYSGMACGGTGGLIEANLIYDVMKSLADGGAIYVSFCKRLTIRGNVVRDVTKAGGYGSSAYYLDEQADDCVVEGNLSLNTWRPTHDHMAHRNVLRDNVFVVEGGKAAGSGDLTMTFPKSDGYRLEHNVIYATGAVEVEDPQAIVAWTDNIVYSGAGKREGVPASVDGRNPLFRDAAHGDFRFEPASPALALGIPELKVGDAGRLKRPGEPAPETASGGQENQ